MSDNSLPTDFLIAAHIRIAAQQGVPIVVRQRGDASRGAMLLKINLLNGFSRILMQARYDDEQIWSPLGKDDPMTEDTAEQCLLEQASFDPDLWILEIEDRLGRTWFEGRVMVGPAGLEPATKPL